MVALVVKYEMPWHELKGIGGAKEAITRRELNERFGQSDKTPDIEPPDEGEHLWEWFWGLSSRRQQGMNGPQPLSYQEIAIWSRLTGTILLREELAALSQMDAAYLNAVAEEQSAQRRRQESRER